MRVYNSLEELINGMDTFRVESKTLRPLIENADINFKVTLPLDKNLLVRKLGDTYNFFNFSNCHFNYECEIRSTKINLTFENCSFEKLNVDHSRFDGKIRFRSCRFLQSFKPVNTVFNDLTDFWNTEFEKKVNFYKTDFNQTAVFSRSRFKENVLFTYTQIRDLLILRSARFYKGLDLSLANITGTIQPFNMYIWDEDFKTLNLYSSKTIKAFQDVNNDHDSFLSAYDKAYENAVSEDSEIPIENKRETYRIIKNEFLKSNDYVNAVPYRVREYKTLWVEAWRKLRSGITFWNPFSNIVLTFLNGVSNWYGSSYLLGLIFTIGIASFSLYLILINSTEIIWSSNPFDWDWQRLVVLLNPVHKIEQLNLPLNDRVYVIDILSRIFVGYGIYQTVQAFRKFK